LYRSGGIIGPGFDLKRTIETDRMHRMFEKSLVNHVLHIPPCRGGEIMRQLHRIGAVNFEGYFGPLPTAWKLAESPGAG
jgi:hypothetical protein